MMKRETKIKIGFYLLSLAVVAGSLYLVNLGVFIEWQASFPNAPAEKMRPWAYLYYGIALALLGAAIWAFRKAWKRP